MTPGQQQKLLDDVHSEIARLASVIDAPSNMLPDVAKAVDGTWISLGWHEADDGNDEDGWYLSLMRNEDGCDWELAEVLSDSPDYLLYVLFDEITATLAKDDKKTGDQRIEWFATQEDLLSRLNPMWRDRTFERHARALKA